MTTHDWHHTRELAIRRFGDELPMAQAEEDVRTAFLERPAAVLRLIDDIGADYQAGKVRSGWAVLRKRLAMAATTLNATVDDTTERDVRVRAAETWIRNCGAHIDREDELVDELNRMLRPFHHDQTLKERLVHMWEQVAK